MRYSNFMTRDDELLSLIDSEDLEKDYILLYDCDDNSAEGLARVTGFTFIDYAIINGEDCTILSKTDEKVWLQEEWVDQYWNGRNWVEVVC